MAGLQNMTPFETAAFPLALLGTFLSIAGNAAAAESPQPITADWFKTAAVTTNDSRNNSGTATGEGTEGAADKSYLIPIAEILGFDFLLNQFNRHFISDDYKSTLPTIRHNLRSSWEVDHDPFTVNQIGHPYQGSMYHGFARSAGLDYWESLGYTVAGSALWEVAGENTPPSRNDQITTGFGGSFLGESLFRMAGLVLDDSDMPKFWRELAAAAISPSTGFNRLAFGDRFKSAFSSHDPEYYGRLAVGVATVTRNETGPSDKLQHTEGLVDFSLDYGLPGKSGYSYDRPFDYFSFQATASTANGFENLMTRGLLFGTDYELGKNYRGIWGLYGSFDYIEPQIFRVSSTALSIGTNGQWWVSNAIALQGSALAGAGYAAVGTVHGTTDNDYHFGVTPQGLISLRAIFGDRASLGTTTREYFVSRAGDSARTAHDNIIRTDVAFTVRVYERHAVSVRYLLNRRDTSSSTVGDISQSTATIGLFYTLLGKNNGFGAYDWR